MRTIIKCSVATLLLLCGLSISAQAQTFASLEQVVSRLQEEKAPSALAKTLRLSSCGRTSSCSGYDMAIRVLHPHLDATTETAIVQVEQLQSADLVVFVHNSDGSWTWVDSLPLEFRYEPLKLEFRSLVKAPVEEIIVHNNTADSGTGIYQGHFLIIKFVSGRLQVVFAATAKENADPVGGIPWEAVSTFQLASSGGETPSVARPATVTQTTKYEIGRRHHTVVRTFAWDDRFKVFLPEMGDKIQ